MKKLAIVTTHPIQYNAPLFSLLAERKKLCIKVFYTWSQAIRKVYDPGFGKEREWDIPLLDGYDFTFVENTAKNPGSHHFFGITNPTLVAEIEGWQPDVVLVFGWSFQSHLSCMRYFKGKKPVLFRGDSTLLGEKGVVKKMLRRVFLHWVYKHIDIALYVGQRNRNYFLQHGVKEERLLLAPHAVDNHRFQLAVAGHENRRALYRQNLGISNDDFVILFVGKLEPVKNPGYLLQLAVGLPEKRIKFVVVGTGEMEAELKTKAQKEKFFFLGFQNQSVMPYIYQMADVLIMPSLSETWGLAANEAMACGLPVILSNGVAGAVDLVLEGETGITFDKHDTLKVRDYLMHLAGSIETYYKTQCLVKAHIEKFAYDRVASSIEGAILNATKNS